MKAVYLPGNKKVEIRSVEIPRPSPDEVLIQIKASCICRSDLSLYYGNAVISGGPPGGCISGHEPAGVIVETGQSTRVFKKGDRVAVYLAIGCGNCSFCRMGNFHLCSRWRCLGFTANGGNAEYLAVPERNCLLIPDDMSFVAAAISTDAFGTLFSACRKVELSGAKTLGLWGLGPMGASGVLAAKALGARVVALDPIAERRRFAETLGADLTLDPTAESATKHLFTFTGGRGVDAAIDCSGNQVAQNMALDSTAPLGRVVLIGEAKETTIRPSEQLIRKQLTVMGSWYFNIAEYHEIVRVVTASNIDLERLATHRFTLDDAETAFRLFDRRETEKVAFVFPD